VGQIIFSPHGGGGEGGGVGWGGGGGGGGLWTMGQRVRELETAPPLRPGEADQGRRVLLNYLVQTPTHAKSRQTFPI
jgi:hypothetical protein